jgi:hypothetical protein
MFYFIRRIKFSPKVNSSYFSNPTKFLELALTDSEQSLLHNYLTISQQIRYRILTNFSENDVFPMTFFVENDQSLEGFVCVGSSDIYEFLEKIICTNEYRELSDQLVTCSNIMDWKVDSLRVCDYADTDLDFVKVKRLWQDGQEIASDQSCQKIACL